MVRLHFYEKLIEKSKLEYCLCIEQYKIRPTYMEAGICYFMNDQIHEWLVDHQIPYRFGYLYEFDNIHEWSVQYVDLQLWWIEFEVKEHAMLFKLTWL